MKITVLTRGRSNYSSRRLRAAAVARGHSVRTVDVRKFSLSLEDGRPGLLHGGRPYRRPDAVIPRVGPSVAFVGTAVVRQFELWGVPCLNGADAIAVARDKLRATQVLCERGLPIPPTAYVHDRTALLAAIEQVGGAPVIIKLLEGAQGIGVILAESLDVAEAIIQTLQSARLQVLVQRFVAESKGTDLRAMVVGGRVVAAMRRSAAGGGFRSNVHRGGTAEGVVLPADHERAAVRAAEAMGLRVAGVDLLESADGPQVLEVNSSPGLEGVEAATGVDVAGEIVQCLEEIASAPPATPRPVSAPNA